MHARLPILLGALAVALFAVALAVAAPFSSPDPGNANDVPVRLARVDVVVQGGFAYRHVEAHVTDTPRLKMLSNTLPMPLPASGRVLRTSCADCLETTVTLRTTGGAVRAYRWTEIPPRGLAPFAKALARMI